MPEKKSNPEPVFTRGDVAKILNVTPLTIANREKRNQYPQAKRDLNGYRIYSLNDIFNLQLLTYHRVDTKPILSILWDKGYRDAKEASKIIDSALDKKKGLR